MAKPAGTENFEQTLARTYQTNPRLMAARASLRALDESLPQARSNWFRPKVAGSVSANYLLERQSQTGSSEDPSELELFQPQIWAELSFPLYRGGQTRNAILSAQSSIRAGEQRLRSTEQAVLGSAAAAYFAVSYYRSLVRISLEEIEKGYLPLEKMLTGMVQNRTSTITDLAQVQLQLQLSRAAYDANLGLVGAAESRFEAATGALPGDLLVPQLPAVPAESLAAALRTGLALNPDVLAANASQTTAGYGVALQKGALLPNLDLIATVEQTWTQERTIDATNRRISDDELQAVFGFRVSIPIYAGGARYSEVREARQSETAARDQARYARRQVRVRIASAWRRQKILQSELDFYEQSATAARQAVEGLLEEFRSGSTSMQEVLTARETLYLALENAETSRFKVRMTRVVLLEAMGLFEARSLKLPVSYYDPGFYLEAVEGKWIGWGIDEEHPEHEVAATQR
ncbi:MAG: TolC family protein [Candidatus Binatia bacterium]|nr:TolC family protein [Candidatus Binatia bacterium]